MLGSSIRRTLCVALALLSFGVACADDYYSLYSKDKVIDTAFSVTCPPYIPGVSTGVDYTGKIANHIATMVNDYGITLPGVDLPIPYDPSTFDGTLGPIGLYVDSAGRRGFAAFADPLPNNVVFSRTFLDGILDPDGAVHFASVFYHELLHLQQANLHISACIEANPGITQEELDACYHSLACAKSISKTVVLKQYMDENGEYKQSKHSGFFPYNHICEHAYVLSEEAKMLCALACSIQDEEERAKVLHLANTSADKARALDEVCVELGAPSDGSEPHPCASYPLYNSDGSLLLNYEVMSRCCCDVFEISGQEPAWGSVGPGDCDESGDWDKNKLPDFIDIKRGTLDDANANGIPDECEGL